MRNFLLLVLLLVLAVSASGSTISYDRYNSYDGTNDCTYGLTSACSFSGWWAYGNTTVSSDTYSGTYNGTTWVSAGSSTTNVDGYGTYKGINKWGKDWGAGAQSSDSITLTNTSWTSNYADTTGYSSLNGGSSNQKDSFAGFFSYYYTCDHGVCTQYNTAIMNTDREYEALGWWASFRFGQFTDGGTWESSFRDQFPDAIFNITQFLQDGTPMEALGPVPEPGTFVLLGAGLVGLAVLRRRK